MQQIKQTVIIRLHVYSNCENLGPYMLVKNDLAEIIYHA